MIVSLYMANPGQLRVSNKTACMKLSGNITCFDLISSMKARITSTNEIVLFYTHRNVRAKYQLLLRAKVTLSWKYHIM